MAFSRRKAMLAAGLTMAAGLVLTSIGVSRAGDRSAEEEGARLVAEWTRTAEEAPSRRASIDANFLSRFNSGELDYSSLPTGELSVSGAPAYALNDAVSRGSLVVVADLVKMTFYTGKMADIPISVWAVRAQSTLKGDSGPGELISIEVLGGPTSRANRAGSSCANLPGLTVPRLGDRLVLILERELGSGPLVFVNWMNVYTIRNGVVVDDEFSRAASIAGMPEKDLVALLAESVKTQ